MVSSSQLHRWVWELPVFPSWLPRSTDNIIISHILLMHPLWKTKRPLLFAGGAGNAPPHPSQTSLGELSFPPANPHEMPLLPGTKSLSDPKPASPPMDLQKLKQAAVIYSHLELPVGSAARGGIAMPCVRGQPHSPMDQEVSASRRSHPLTTPGDRLTLLAHHRMGYGVPHSLDAAQILQPAETLPMSQGAGPVRRKPRREQVVGTPEQGLVATLPPDSLESPSLLQVIHREWERGSSGGDCIEWLLPSLDCCPFFLIVAQF